MTRTKAEKTALIYQTAVIVAGLGLWLASVVFLFIGQTRREQLTLMGFLPLIIVWVGTGLAAKILIIFLLAMLPIAMMAMVVLRNASTSP